MSISKLTVWNLVWVLLIAALASVAVGVGLGSREHVATMDWPDGYSSTTLQNDAWGGPLILGRQPDRIRRVERRHGRTLDPQGVSYFASVPMSQAEFEHELGIWQSKPELKFHRSEIPAVPTPDYWPQWFPHPSPDNYVGSLTASGDWHISVYRVGGTDNIYLVL